MYIYHLYVYLALYIWRSIFSVIYLAIVIKRLFVHYLVLFDLQSNSICILFVRY